MIPRIRIYSNRRNKRSKWRIYKNIPQIQWKNKVHEVLDGYKTMSLLPREEEYALYHPKTIERQEKQNNYYDTIQ